MSVSRKSGLLAVAGSLAFCVSSWAQSPSNSSCFSSTVQAKSTANHKAQKQDPSATDSPHRRVILERIEFDQPVHLSSSDVDKVVNEANDSDYDANSLAWVDAVSETGLRLAWQDQGYFLAAVDPQAQSLGGEASEERFVLNVHVLEEGPQFHLGSIQFTGNTAFTEGELRQAIPIREGEIFNVAHVRAALESLTKLYGTRGYIDFTVVPNTTVNENLQRIDLVMHLDEQKQFRIRNVEVRGLDPALEARLRTVIIPGEIFDYDAISSFFKQDSSLLPHRALDILEIRRDLRAGLVDVAFDPGKCRNSN